MGDPEPAFGAGRYLEALLRERFPARKFEVVNVAITAINSHVIRAIARDCARQPAAASLSRLESAVARLSVINGEPMALPLPEKLQPL